MRAEKNIPKDEINHPEFISSGNIQFVGGYFTNTASDAGGTIDPSKLPNSVSRIQIPSPPATGTHTLRSVNGMLTWS